MWFRSLLLVETSMLICSSSRLWSTKPTFFQWKTFLCSFRRGWNSPQLLCFLCSTREVCMMNMMIGFRIFTINYVMFWIKYKWTVWTTSFFLWAKWTCNVFFSCLRILSLIEKFHHYLTWRLGNRCYTETVQRIHLALVKITKTFIEYDNYVLKSQGLYIYMQCIKAILF